MRPADRVQTCALRRYVDEVRSIGGETDVIRLVFTALPILRRVSFAVALTVRTRTNAGAAGAGFGLRDRLFTLVDLFGERRLGRSLCRGGRLLGAANLGRVLRGGQVGELQIHGTYRHGPLLPREASVLLSYRRPAEAF